MIAASADEVRERVYEAIREIEGRVDEPRLLEAVDRVGVEEVRAMVAERKPLRRACCERALEIGPNGGELAEALCVIGASTPDNVDAACDLIRPAEASVRRRIARRRRRGVTREELERSLAELGERKAREALSRRDCHTRLVAIAADPQRGLREREAAAVVAAGDYEAARALCGAPPFAEIAGREGRRGLGAELRKRRKRGVGEQEVATALTRLGCDRVESALRQDGLPFGRLCLEAAGRSDAEERSAWLCLGAAGASRTWRALGPRTVAVCGEGERRELPVGAALERVRMELFGASA